MPDYDVRLNELREKIARKNHLENLLADLEKQSPILKHKMRSLESAKDKEEKRCRKDGRWKFDGNEQSNKDRSCKVKEDVKISTRAERRNRQKKKSN